MDSSNSQQIEILYIPSGQFLRYFGDDNPGKANWSAGTMFDNSIVKIKDEITAIILMSMDSKFKDADGNCWEDCWDWIKLNEIQSPCVEADFEIVVIQSEDTDNQIS